MVKYGTVKNRTVGVCVAVGCFSFRFVSCVKKDRIIELVTTGLTGFWPKNNYK